MPYLTLTAIAAAFPCIDRGEKAVLIAVVLSVVALIIKELIKYAIFLPDKKEKNERATARQVDRNAETQNRRSRMKQHPPYETKTHLSDEIAVVAAKKALHETRLASIDGLADKDKNRKTVETLLSFFESGKISSIEDGLALYAEQNRHDGAEMPSDTPS